MLPLSLPDTPRWVEAHGIAADPASWRRDLARGFVVGSDRAALVVASADAEAAGVIGITEAHPGHAILVATAELASAMRSVRPVTRAIIHTLPEPMLVPDLDGATPLPRELLDTLPPPLATELRASTGTIWTAVLDGAPVSFAYAPWRSARWFDISVDTLLGARQLGLATIVAAALIHDERAAGREPVWGAEEDNHASLALARRLGFEAVDELWVAVPGAAHSPTTV